VQYFLKLSRGGEGRDILCEVNFSTSMQKDDSNNVTSTWYANFGKGVLDQCCFYVWFTSGNHASIYFRLGSTHNHTNNLERIYILFCQKMKNGEGK